MSAQEDYSKLTLQELLGEEKKLKRNEIFAAASIGFLVGVMVYGVVRNGFGFLYVAIPLAMIVGIYRNSQSQKQVLQQVRAEISLRNRG
ncbi:FUSC family protein [Hymenobacter canadensis]|uniref:FUSC family protein n=1 Tax=Hymenobacter canadensis TaxID=2999067 RepID=A0ABY7LT77_9BACT|nr:FUSC family protein [Hymenobacter canadensis]WBA41925.1 FUSC family protein [Hymenobacter canadensis]